MTLAEIYNTIVSIVYGDPASPPPVHEIAQIQTDILRMHHEVQQNHNYWFMYYKTTFPFVSGTYTYTLPTAYKQLIYLETDYEYELLGNQLYFCNEDVTKTENVRFDYWQFITTPAWQGTYTDYVTANCHWIIIYAIVSNLKLKREGMQAAQFYAAKATEAEDAIKAEDIARRQEPKSTW